MFTLGCNFRCGYCHNPEFVLPESVRALRPSCIPEETFFNFLEERRGLLDGVVVTGGEPTIMPDLPQFFRKIKALGFRTKLDTNGNNPTMLRKLLDDELLDYVAMDVKTSLGRYCELVGPVVRPANIASSIEILKTGTIDYEFRSTILQETHPQEVLGEMAELVRGARRWYLQTFRPAHTLDPAFADYHAYSGEEMQELCKKFVGVVGEVAVR